MARAGVLKAQLEGLQSTMVPLETHRQQLGQMQRDFREKEMDLLRRLEDAQQAKV
jgi:hypothetical protein